MIFNPHAGRLTSLDEIQRAADELAKHGWQIEICESQSGADTTRLSREAAEQKLSAVFVAGGDGSIELAAAGLVDTETAIGVLPIGTANVLARQLGLPTRQITNRSNLVSSARQLAESQIQGVDVGRCNRELFLLWAGVGLDAYIVHNIEPRQRWQKLLGAGYYAASALAWAAAWKGLDLELTLDGRVVSGHFLLVIVSNIRLYAGGLATLSPNAVLDDGLMDLWLFDGESILDALRHAAELIAGKHIESPLARRLPVTDLRMRAAEPIQLQIDGEPLVVGNEVRIQVKPQALKVLVPSGSSEGLFKEKAIATRRQTG